MLEESLFLASKYLNLSLKLGVILVVSSVDLEGRLILDEGITALA